MRERRVWVRAGRARGRRRAAVAFVLSLGVSCVATAAAQSAGAIAGRVTTAGTDSAVAGAFVLVEGTLGRAVTDAQGRYLVRDVAAGQRLVRVLRVGYQMAERVVAVPAGDTARQDFALEHALLRLEPVTVTASRGTRLIGDVPASQVVVSNREILDRNVLTLDQELPFVSGVSFNDGDIDIRGSTGAAGGVGSRVLLLLDGHSVLTADGGETDFTSLPLLDVDRIEVVKGAYSALYGSNALGGVVNIVTTPVTGPPETVADLHYGAYDEPDNYRFGDGQYPSFAGFMLQHSREFGDVGVRGVVQGETSDGFRQDDHSSRWFLRAKVDVPSGSDHPVSAYAIYTTGDVGNFFMWDSSAFPTRPPANTLNDWAHDTKLSLGATIMPIARGALRLAVDPYVEKDGTQNHFPSDTDFSFHNAAKYGTTAQLTLAPSVSQTVTLGGEAAETQVQSDILGRPHLEDEGLYAQDEAAIASRFTATVGVRMDAHQATGSSNETTLSPKFGLAYRVSPTLSLRASVARGYRAAAAIEQFVNSRQSGIPVHPNPGLHGETAWSTELGATATVTPWFWVDGAVYESDYHDLIGPGIIPDSGFVFQFQNVQRARVRGVDVGTKTTIVPNVFDVAVNYTFLDTYDYEFKGPLPYRSQHYATASFNVLGGLTGLDIRYRSRVERVLLFPADPRGPITLVDFRAGAKVFGSFVQAKVSNLFQDKYVDVMERTPGAPRTLFLTVLRSF